MEALSDHFWNIFRVLEIIVIGYEFLLIGGFLPIRHLFLGDRVDCIMDGLQNVTQLRNETYMERVRNYCGLFAVPPNYVQLEGFDEDLFVRIEPRNQTFVESVDYFLAKGKESQDFRIFYTFLIMWFIIVVKLPFFKMLNSALN